MSSLCEFVFQRRFGNKWITYSDSEIEHINKALKRQQKTVTLPCKNTKKRIVINFRTMIQKNTVSNVEQKIRALIFSKNFYAWTIVEDGHELACFKPFQVYFLEAGVQRGIDVIKFYDDGDYLVDLRQLIEINEKYRYSRRIIREKVVIKPTARIEEIAHQNKVQLQSLETLRCLYTQQRIFDPSISSVAPHSRTSEVRFPSSLFFNTIETNSDKSSKVAVDKECPYAEVYEVYSEGVLFYSAILLSTSIENNMNNYLLMQILKQSENFFLWQKTSRVGYKTQTYLKEFETNINDTKREFEVIFYEKTNNNWQDVINFKHVPGYYDLLKMELSQEVIDENATVKSYLPNPVQELMTLITSQRMMNQIMEEMEYDLEESPLGQLTISQIIDGYSALSKVTEEALIGEKGKDLIDACDKFYMKIPHNFGKKTPPVIRTLNDISGKMKMMEALLNINIAQKIIFHPPDRNTDHPLDRYYKAIDCELNPLDPTSSEYEVIQRYLDGTCGPTHTDFQTDIISIFACNKPLEEETFTDLGNNYLLWHGSRLINWVGILKEGLHIAPAEAPSSGAMFGKGLYFADMSSKSANYCFPTKKHNFGVLMLCEVSLGKSLELSQAVQNLPQVLPPGYQSVIGKGKCFPTSFESGAIPGGAKIPVGPVVEDIEIVSCLRYNEYVVYNKQQVKMKYLILIQCNFNETIQK